MIEKRGNTNMRAGRFTGTRNKAKGRQSASGRTAKKLRLQNAEEIPTQIINSNKNVENAEEKTTMEIEDTQTNTRERARVSRMMDWLESGSYDAKKISAKKKSSFLNIKQARKKKYKRWTNPKVVVFQNDKGFVNQFSDF